jgi:hypothetical protein
VSEAELTSDAGIPLLLHVGGRVSKKSLAGLQECVIEWSRDEGGAVKSMRSTQRSLEALITLSELGLGTIVSVVEKLSRREQCPFLFSLGALSDTERGMLERLLKPDSLYVQA